MRRSRSQPVVCSYMQLHNMLLSDQPIIFCHYMQYQDGGRVAGAQISSIGRGFKGTRSRRAVKIKRTVRLTGTIAIKGAGIVRSGGVWQGEGLAIL